MKSCIKIRQLMMAAAMVAVALGLGICLPDLAKAGFIAGWDFSTITTSGGNLGNSPMTATTTDPNDTVGGLTRGWTVGAGTAAAYAWGGNNFAQSPNNTEAGAIAANNVATFSVTANSGYTLSLSDIPAYNIRRSATGPNTGLWQYEVDGGAFTDIGAQITWGSVTTSAGNPEPLIDLSGIPALQNVAAGTTVTFRCVTWGATSTSGTWYFNEPGPHTTDPDIGVEGSLGAVPEPCTLGLLAIGGACALASLVVRRRG